MNKEQQFDDVLYISVLLTQLDQDALLPLMFTAIQPCIQT